MSDDIDNERASPTVGSSCPIENQATILEPPLAGLDLVNDEMGSSVPEDNFKEELRDDLVLDFLDELTFEDLAMVEDQIEPLTMKVELLTNKTESGQLEEEIENLSQSPPIKKVKETEREFGEQSNKKRTDSRKRLHPKTVFNIGVSSSMIKVEPVELDYVSARNLEKPAEKGHPAPQVSTPPVLSIVEKRKLAVERVNAVLKLSKMKSSKVLQTEFLVVDTFRKISSSRSLLIFENPSPLSNNFNVKYKFNSTTKGKINISKWGLERLPAVTTELLRLTGIDVTRLMELMKNSKMRLPPPAKKALVNHADDGLSNGLFRSISTQTDGHLDNLTRDVGVQITQTTQDNDVFWLNSEFSESKLSQQQANVMLAFKELCATSPSSTFWADALYNSLHNALLIKRQEVKEIAMKKSI